VVPTEIFESVVKLSIGHSKLQLFENIGIFWFEVQTHLSQPFEVFRTVDLLIDQGTRHVSFMDMFNDLREE
jgi:hypothetical protein